MISNPFPGRPSDRARFGPFEIDLHTRELWKFGTRLKLVGQPFEILTVLLSRPGELVTREELRDRLWPSDTFVDFNHGLNAAVNKLRDALSDSADEPRYIETLPRRGYRFIAVVDWLPVSASGPRPVRSARSTDSRSGRSADSTARAGGRRHSPASKLPSSTRDGRSRPFHIAGRCGAHLENGFEPRSRILHAFVGRTHASVDLDFRHVHSGVFARWKLCSIFSPGPESARVRHFRERGRQQSTGAAHPR